MQLAFGASIVVLFGMLPGHAGAAAAPRPCSARELEKLTVARPVQMEAQRRRAAELSASLSCAAGAGSSAIAAAAAYELALFYSGATGLDTPDLQRAIIYANQSVELLHETGDRKLWFKTSLAAARLQMYSAQDIDALAEIRHGLDQLSGALQDVRSEAAVSEYYQLLAELNTRIFEAGESGARMAALDAIRHYLATETGRKPTTARAEALETKARMLIAHTAGGGQRQSDDLDQAMASLEEAKDLYRELGSRDGRRRTQVNLAMIYLRREGAGYARRIETAISLLKDAVADMNQRRDREAHAAAANNLGSAFMARQEGVRDENMLESVRWFKLARNHLDPKVPDEQALWVRSSVNLAMALAETKIEEEKHLQDADEVLTQTIQWLEARGRLEDTVKPLAVQFGIRLTWASWGHASQLDAAEALLSKADQRSARLPAAQRASLKADRGEYLRYRFEAGDAGALDQAIASYRAAIALADVEESPAVWASMQNNLGNACNTRRRPDLFSCALHAYQQALLVRTEAAMPRDHADTLVNLANLQFENANWAEAADLYSAVARRYGGMFEKISRREVLLTAAGRSKRWFERAAYALAKQGRAEEGLWIAEQGKTRLLKRRLGVSEPTGDAVQHDDLASIDAADGTLVLAPIVSTKGGMVFALFRSGRGWVLRSVFIDGLDADAVVTFMQGAKHAGAAGSGWLGAYRGIVGQEVVDEAAQLSWTSKLRESQTWLGEKLVQPVLSALRPEGMSPTTVVWMTQGELAVLPIHAALMDDGKTLVEHVPVMYAPSLLLLRRPAELPARRHYKAISLVSMGNPGSGSPLPFSELEARSAFAKLPPSRARLLMGGKVTAARVKEALQRARVFHFAGHASFNREDPQQSHLLLADAQRVTVADLQAVAGGDGPDLVILSACESGLIQIFDIANEFQGLPAAFIGLGAKGVVSSLWPADDVPALFLVDRLTEATLVRNRPVPEALRDAQLWLKDARGEELARVARRLSRLVEDAASKARLAKLAWIFEHRPQLQPYADPAQWAGYYYSGRDIHGNDSNF